MCHRCMKGSKRFNALHRKPIVKSPPRKRYMKRDEVEPVLSGHPPGMAKRSLSRGDRSKGFKITISKKGHNFRNFDNWPLNRG